MFGLFKQKSDVQKMVNEIGLDRTAEHYAGVILQKIPNQRVFNQFILEELDAAKMGNDAAQDFVRETGIPFKDYMGAMGRSFPEVDGPNGPQQALVRICLELGPDGNKIAALRIGVVRRLLKKAPFGPVESEAGA